MCAQLDLQVVSKRSKKQKNIKKQKLFHFCEFWNEELYFWKEQIKKIKEIWKTMMFKLHASHGTRVLIFEVNVQEGNFKILWLLF
jgi:hypothetical protein